MTDYKFDKMNILDSISVPLSEATKARVAAYRFRTKNKNFFFISKMEGDKIVIVRIPFDDWKKKQRKKTCERTKILMALRIGMTHYIEAKHIAAYRCSINNLRERNGTSFKTKAMGPSYAITRIK